MTSIFKKIILILLALGLMFMGVRFLTQDNNLEILKHVVPKQQKSKENTTQSKKVVPLSNSVQPKIKIN